MPVNYKAIATSHPKLARGQVWCHECGATVRVNAGQALRSGWPECCGYTMSLDAPAEAQEE